MHARNLVIVGDFNTPNFVNYELYDRKSFSINNFINFFSFNQLNHVLNVSDRLLDLLLSNIKCEVLHDNAPLLHEDVYHPALLINLLNYL